MEKSDFKTVSERLIKQTDEEYNLILSNINELYKNKNMTTEQVEEYERILRRLQENYLKIKNDLLNS